jgi:PAS domain S-box-containing protein
LRLSEFLGATHVDKRILEELEETLRARHQAKVRTWLSRRDGTRYMANIDIESSDDETGTITQYVGAVSDETELETVRLENNRLLEFSVDPLWVASPGGSLTQIGQTLARVLGYEESDLLGRPWFSLVHPEEAAQVVESMRASRSGESAIDLVNRFMCREGNHVWLQWSLFPDRTSGLLYGVSRDISLAIDDETQIRHLHERLELALLGAGFGIWEFDVGAGRFIWDERMYEIYGQSPETMDNTGEAWMNCIHPDDRQRVYDEFMQLAAGEKITARTCRITRGTDGQVRTIEANGYLQLDSAGNPNRLIGMNRDVTESVYSHARFIKNEALLNEAQARAKIGNWTWCPAANELFWSKELHRIFELPEGHPPLDPEQFSDRVHPEDRDIANLRFPGASASECNHFEIEYRITFPDGRVKWIFAIIDREVDATGQIKRWGGTAQDITERKLAENALRESEERWKFALEGSGDAVWDWNIAEQRTLFSSQWKQMLGYEDHEIGSGLTEWSSRVHPDDMERAMRDLHAYFRGDTPEYETEHRLRCKDGTYKWILDRGMVTRWASDGTPLRMVGTNTDITRRLASERQFEALAGNVPGVVYQFILDSDDSYRFTYLSGGCQDIWGYSSEEFQSNFGLLWSTVPEDEVEGFKSSIEESARSLSPWEHRWRSVSSSGDVKWLHGRAKPYGRPNGDTVWDGVVIDISEQHRSESERQQLEIQLREAQKMEAIGTLAGGIAHDFNNLLGAIIGNAELARQDVDPQSPATVSLSEINKAAVRAKGLVQQILTFSRRQPHELEVLDLVPLMEEGIGLLRALLPSGISIVDDLGKSKTFAKADATQVSQVLMNLCTNAWHALPDGLGTIEVSLTQVEIGPNAPSAFRDLPQGPYARLSVRDDGVGIPADSIDRIFEPFFTTKAVGEGTGLGLSVVHGIVKEHGGAILVKSSLNTGSTFEVYLPIVHGAEDLLIEPPATPVPGVRTGQHILYVDDEEAMVFLVQRMLERLGYRTTAFDRPDQAVNAFRETPNAFDLVVTDHNMPGASGLDVAREIRAIRSDMPIAIISGYLSDDLIRKSSEIGVTEVVYKPNTIEELCQSIRSLIG